MSDFKWIQKVNKNKSRQIFLSITMNTILGVSQFEIAFSRQAKEIQECEDESIITTNKDWVI